MAQRPKVDSELAGYRRMAGEVYDILQRTRPQQEPHEYSEESRRLARKLAEEVQLKLRSSGRTLARDPETGRYIIVDLPVAAPSATAETPPRKRRSLLDWLRRR